MRVIFADDRAPPHLAARAACGGYGHKIRYLLRDIYIAANEIIIIEQIPPVMHPEYNGPRHIHRSPAADPDDRIPIHAGKDIPSLQHTRFYRVLMDLRKYLDRK